MRTTELSHYAKWYKELKGYDFVSSIGRTMNRFELYHNGFKDAHALKNGDTPYTPIKRPEPIFESE